MVTEISQCRICRNTNLRTILDLGEQALTGVFPKQKEERVPTAPLVLVKCMNGAAGSGDACGLVQLKHSVSLPLMYGDNYGYRSGLNRSMVEHLHGKVRKILARCPLRRGDLIIDIGANDSTTLQAYPIDQGLRLVGVDPTGKKFQSFYPNHIELVADFFSETVVKAKIGSHKARVITSFSMFYDLEDPAAFMREVHGCLADDGIWVMEQSYLSTMLAMNSYDTICHEHLEYYALRQIVWLANRIGFRISDVELNDINGGSFSVTLEKSKDPMSQHAPIVNQMLGEEEKIGLETLKPYQQLEINLAQHKKDLLEFLESAKKQGRKVFGYGASTKGNVLLQYCRIDESAVPFIAEVNENKFGCFSPGSLIPIISETEAKKMRPDYFLVLPWHFKESILKRESAYLAAGGKFVFPLPHLQVVG